MEEIRNTYKIYFENKNESEVLGIAEGSKMDLKTLGRKSVDWIHPTKVSFEFRSLNENGVEPVD